MYPTAAKLIAAILFGALSWWLSDLVRPFLPQEGSLEWLAPVNAVIGMVMGWRVLGSRAGRGYGAAIGYGWTALAVTLFWVLLVWSGREMLERSMRLYYDGPMDAIEQMIALFVEYGAHAANTSTAVSALFGAGFCGLVTEFAARNAA
ncbi:tellurium resistance protein [Mesobaculum littorinae]|uniref:Tellurium resistance protein n=1 Tax=Mesobaculum littorinae TaxID=2486419 RepID=A0A438AJ74_9RHOB|nr:TrgA family protein [Mesobaculum littorinae]RVV98657.1 tellurium resistance protein [Mesobaculum littorinae]